MSDWIAYKRILLLVLSGIILYLLFTSATRILLIDEIDPSGREYGEIIQFTEKRINQLMPRPAFTLQHKRPVLPGFQT